MTERWRWAGASSVGTSHVKSGLECQDRASCLTLETACGSVILAVVSDGAGSAKEASRGAFIVCSDLQRNAVGYLRDGGLLADLNVEIVADWLDSIRERIGITAKANALTPRDYAATLVALMIGDDHAVVMHVGDGAAVIRMRETREWSVPSWPYHGQYASTTRFVIDDPQAQVVVTHLEAVVDRFAVFSDGVEYLFLDFQTKTPPQAFFERLLQPFICEQSPGRSRRLSKHLRDYLASELVCIETDDDKSLILGVRA